MCAQLCSTQLWETMDETWDRSDVLDLSPAMYPPEFMWAEEGEYDLEIEERVIQEHFNETVDVLDGGLGYDTLSGMKERLDAHHSRAEEAATRFESRRNYARLQVATMKEKVLSIAREREGENSDEAVLERGNQILDEPMGKHWKTEDGAVRMTEAPTEEWFVMASGYNTDERWEENGEIPLSDISIHLRPEKGDWATEFTEDHLHPTDKRLFDGDDTWRDALESIHRRRKHLEESYEQARQTRELLRFRRAVVETVLYRFEAYGSVEQMTEAEAQDVAREDPRFETSTPAKWEKNAARMYAYICQFGKPNSIGSLENKIEHKGELKSFSHARAWRKLKEEEYATSEGLDGLVDALEDWAPNFEAEYGARKAVGAAKPFEWPLQRKKS